jgi:hypothetical protein
VARGRVGGDARAGKLRRERHGYLKWYAGSTRRVCRSGCGGLRVKAGEYVEAEQESSGKTGRGGGGGEPGHERGRAEQWIAGGFVVEEDNNEEFACDASEFDEWDDGEAWAYDGRAGEQQAWCEGARQECSRAPLGAAGGYGGEPEAVAGVCGFVAVAADGAAVGDESERVGL